MSLHLNIKKTKIMTTEEIYSFNLDNKDIKKVKDSAHLSSVINMNGDCRQNINRRLRLRRAATKELKMTTMTKDVPLDTNAKMIHTLIFPVIYTLQMLNHEKD